MVTTGIAVGPLLIAGVIVLGVIAAWSGRGGRRVFASIVMVAVCAVVALGVSFFFVSSERETVVTHVASQRSRADSRPAARSSGQSHLRVMDGMLDVTHEDGDSQVRIMDGMLDLRHSDQNGSSVRIMDGLIEVNDGRADVQPPAPATVPDPIESSTPPDEANRYEEGVLAAAAPTLVVEEPWQSAAELGFEADVYPSQEAAVRSLARQVYPALAKLLPEGQTLQRVFVIRRDEVEPATVSPGVWAAAQEEFQRQDGSLEVKTRYWPHGESVPGDGTVTIRISVPRYSGTTPAPWARNPRDEQRAGPIEMTASTVGVHRDTVTSRTAQYVEKPWVENTAAFASRDPDRHWLIARSSQTATSQTEAVNQAANVAVAKLVPEVETLLQERMDRRQITQNAAVLQSVIRAQLRGAPLSRELEPDARVPRLARDGFTQSFTRPYGAQIWRHAILVDASYDQIHGLAEVCELSLGEHSARASAAAREQKVTWARRALSIGGLVILIFVVYLFLNAATKGYYVWALRGAVIVLVAAGIVLLLNVT